MSNWDISNAGKLVFLIGLIVGSIGAGYGARRAGLGDRAARRMMYFVIIVPYTLVGFLAIWKLNFRGEFTVLPVFGFAVMSAGVIFGALLARWMGMPRASSGAFVLTCGASNLGFTMGGFVNYVLFGEQGLAVAAMYTMFWNFGMVLVLYPVARHYGHGPGQPIWRLVLSNFWDLRSLPLYSVLLGLTLNLTGVPRPAALGPLPTARLVDVFIIAGAVVAFFVTGLRLHFAHLRLHRRLYVLVAAVKFLLAPAVGAALVGAMILAGHPLPFPGGKVVLVQASTPVAIYSVVISNLFGLDDRLASLVFVVNTACYLAIVLPIVVALLG